MGLVSGLRMFQDMLDVQGKGWNEKLKGNRRGNEEDEDVVTGVTYGRRWSGVTDTGT